ncbi:MAG: hypothetical protein ACK5LS_06285 [Propioniciclava sp.]
MIRQLVHGVLALVGVLAVVWALTLGADPEIRCRGAEMAPGEVCTKADGTGEQTWEERYAAVQAARPVVGTLGAGTAGFALALLVGERRRAGGQASRLIGP